ncbi:MAG: hypothetical protein HC844_11735 [Tabrizicola sp.]|nr:hypothetical protein [Tabrizicola sp.]
MPRLIIPVALLACLALAACGADGAPKTPTRSGITVSGEASIGVAVAK